MTDREKLAFLLSTSPHLDVLDGHSYEKAAEDLVTNGVTFAKNTDAPSKWISVEDETPRAEYGESDNVLTVAENGLVEVLYFDGGCWCYPSGGPVFYEDPSWRITHWMPMPEPPKED